jgi:hypothetical protein
MASLHTGVPPKHRIGVWDFIRSHPELGIASIKELLLIGHEETLIRLSKSGLAHLGWRYAYMECFFYQVQNQRSHKRMLKRERGMKRYLIEIEEQIERDKEADKQMDRDRKTYRLYLEAQKGLNLNP